MTSLSGMNFSDIHLRVVGVIGYAGNFRLQLLCKTRDIIDSSSHGQLFSSSMFKPAKNTRLGVVKHINQRAEHNDDEMIESLVLVAGLEPRPKLIRRADLKFKKGSRER